MWVSHECIRHSDGGVSEQTASAHAELLRVYQAFRWWGIGTVRCQVFFTDKSVSGIPMVGYRNRRVRGMARPRECIRHSDGGVSEQYDAFSETFFRSVSGIPMVGYRNTARCTRCTRAECIRHSDGGVSEPVRAGLKGGRGVYQAFRWRGIAGQGSSLAGCGILGPGRVRILRPSA